MDRHQVTRPSVMMYMSMMLRSRGTKMLQWLVPSYNVTAAHQAYIAASLYDIRRFIIKGTFVF